MGMIGPSQGSDGALAIRLAPSTAPSWITTICTLMPRRRSRSDSAAMAGASSVKVRPAVAPALTSSGVVLTTAPMTPTRTPLTRKMADGVTQLGGRPVAVSTMLAPRNGKLARS